MAGANSITVTAMALITAAMQEIGVLASGDNAPIDEAEWVLQKLQRLLDTYNAQRTMVYANVFRQFTLVANLFPHTIGPTIAAQPVPTFSVNQRPVEIPSIGLVLIGSNVEIPLYPMDKDEWAAERVKQPTSNVPTKYYYEPDWPLGSIYFWPVPSAVNNVLLQLRTVISELTAFNSSFSMPPGYWNLTIYELAMEIADGFERTISPNLEKRYQKALKAVGGNNIKSVKGSSAIAGMPGKGPRGGFNYYSGGPD